MMRLVLFSSMLLAGCGENLTQSSTHDPFGTGGGDAGTLDCVPNLDMRIDASELKTAIGIPVSYLVSPPGEDRTVDVKGTPGNDGNPKWDFGSEFASDKTLSLEAEALGGKWYAASFAGGQFATPIDAAKTLEGVYASHDDGITLLGIASATEMPPEGKTLLVYDQPILVYKLPLTPGTSWVSTGNVMNGTIRGLPYAGKDIYEIADDAIGELVVPSLDFTQVHRVRTHVTIMPAAGQSQSTRQVSFVFECFGEVARATSKPGEMQDDFTTAAEVRRLGP